jgi:hypothetical protein
VQLARILLRLDPDIARNVVHLAPILPEEMSEFRADNVLLGRSRVTIRAGHGMASIDGLPPQLTLKNEPRPPLEEYLRG